jgi:glycerol-3-phosphate acyltransferase PlsY
MIEKVFDLMKAEYWLFYLFAYALAATPTAYVILRFVHKTKAKDTRDFSPSAAFVWRTFGKKSGTLVFLLDVAKGALPCAIAHSFDFPVYIIAAIGLAAVLGQCYSMWLYFGGAKGGHVFLGAMLFVCWPATVFAFVVFLLCLALGLKAERASFVEALVLAFGVSYGISEPILWLIMGLTLIFLSYRQRKILKALA